MSTTPSTNSTQSIHGTRLLSEDAHAQGANSKDARAREHARHRTKTKERREHALARERKEKAAVVRVLGLKGTTTAHAQGHGHGQGHGGGNASKLVRKLSIESWDGEMPRDEEKQTQSPVCERSERNDEQGREGASGFTELTLGDIISKPRRPKAKQLDFEMISPIRTVIALDDADGDEPWEYITRASLNDGSSWKGKSYAQAVVSAM